MKLLITTANFLLLAAHPNGKSLRTSSEDRNGLNLTQANGPDQISTGNDPRGPPNARETSRTVPSDMDEKAQCFRNPTNSICNQGPAQTQKNDAACKNVAKRWVNIIKEQKKLSDGTSEIKCCQKGMAEVPIPQFDKTQYQQLGERDSAQQESQKEDHSRFACSNPKAWLRACSNKRHRMPKPNHDHNSQDDRKAGKLVAPTPASQMVRLPVQSDCKSGSSIHYPSHASKNHQSGSAKSPAVRYYFWGNGSDDECCECCDGCSSCYSCSPGECSDCYNDCSFCCICSPGECSDCLDETCSCLMPSSECLEKIFCCLIDIVCNISIGF